MAGAFLLYGIGFSLQFLTTPLGPVLTQLASNIALVAGLATIAAAMAIRYGKPLPVVWMLLISTVGLSIVGWYTFAEPSALWRLRVMNFTVAALFLLAALQIRKNDRIHPVDAALYAVLLLNCMVLIIRTVLLTRYGDATTYTGGPIQNVPYLAVVTVTRTILSIALAATVALAVQYDEARRRAILFRPTMRSESATRANP